MSVSPRDDEPTDRRSAGPPTETAGTAGTAGTTEQAQADGTAQQGKPGGSPLLLVLMAIAVVPSVVLADSFDAGPAAIIGGMVGLFSLVALMGGTLRADLRSAALVVPLLLLGAIVPRLLGEVSRPAAIVLVALIVFVGALLPLRGPTFANTGLGLGMTTLYSYAYATRGATDHQQVITAALAGVVVALLLRVLLGISDPAKPARDQVADVLVADDPSAATATAFDTWLGEGRPRWLGVALEGASRFRLAARAAELTADPSTEAETALRDRARAAAELVRAKKAPAPDAPTATNTSNTSNTATADDPGDPSLARAAAALDAVEQAARERDTTPVSLDRRLRDDLRDSLLHPSARLRSVQVRHAFRTGLGMLVMLSVTADLGPHDPLVASALMTTFGILQASWRETLSKAKAKILGVLVGSAAVAVILLTVPEEYLVAVAGLSLALGLWYITTLPAVGAAFMVMVSVGLNAVTRDLDAADLLVQYVLLVLCGLVVGVVIGFAVVPAFRPPPLRQRIEEATEATTRVLQATAGVAHPHGAHALGSAAGVPLLALHRDAAQKQDELVPDHDDLDDRQLAELDRLRTGLRDLVTMVATATWDGASLTRAAELLRPEDAAATAPGGIEAEADGNAASSTLRDLAEQAGQAERYLLRTLPAGA
ncbi:FUSC family protein [Nocardioides marmotae]|uniref:FUSC family protein n=1 Tax=Nocardioides marmotae TaxID=2663857 RepID=UPI0012B60C49|nr:FUSC family protein [Nocardioides marmotae]MBC9733680.1 hypothetical protein [Nocardioides marmotae]MTB84783.1 hypothetical protein [Nocardioides marmotae]